MKKNRLKALVLGVALMGGSVALASSSGTQMRCAPGRCGANMDTPKEEKSQKSKQEQNASKETQMRCAAGRCGAGRCGGGERN